MEAGSAHGVVEAIEFRTTKIRDGDGRLHIVRNGDMKLVVNYSKDYAVAVVALEVGYDADLRAVFGCLRQVGRQLRADNDAVLAETTIEGITAFGPRSMTIRTSTRVKPGYHGAVAAAMRLLIRDAFEMEGGESLRRSLIPARWTPAAQSTFSYVGPEQAPRAREVRGASSAHSCSVWWTNETAIEPSPTAEATRLTFPPRTSPTANTPGRLVSRRWGARASGHFAVDQVVAVRSGPVLMNPFASSATQPSQPRRVRHRAHHDEHVPDVAGLDAAVSVVAPAHALELVAAFERDDLRSRAERRSSGFPRCGGSGSATWCRPGRPTRTSRCTCRADCARNTAAWPAELPPPTTITSSPSHSCASTNVAP